MVKSCTVTNKSSGMVIYRVPELNVRREFRPRETKKQIPIAELEGLAAQSGGRVLLYNYLMVHEKDAIQYLVNREVAPEYWLKEEDIPKWMTDCSLDAFKDALDFAPEGTKDLIKKYAISLPLNDYSKRQAIKDQLGFDVTSVINNSGEDIKEKKEEVVKPTSRRVPVKKED